VEDLHFDFVSEVFSQIEKAFSKYHITEVLAEDVLVYTDLKGKCAGRCGWKRRNGEVTYHLKFNKQAIEEHWDEQINSTIPHEIAHLICYLRPELGEKHNEGWRRVAVALGDVNAGDRTHTMQLTNAKNRVRYEYNVNGNIILFSPKRHSSLIKGKRTYTHRQYGQILPSMFVRKLHITPDERIITVKPNASQSKPSSSTKVTKAEQALALYRAMNNRGETRAQIIQAYQQQLNMSKPGASTYYYNAKNKMGH